MLRGCLLYCLTFFSLNCFATSILVIESYHADHPWSQNYRQGLQSTLSKHATISYFEMDTKRLPIQRHQEQADKAWQQYQQLTPDIVIIADDNALQTLAPRLLKTTTPVIYFGINANPRKYGITGAQNFTGVLERPLLKRSIMMLREFISIQKALVLFDDSETSKVVLSDVFYGQTTMSIGGIQVDFRQHSQLSQWQQSVKSAKAQNYDAIIIALYHTLKDDQGKHVDSEQVIRWTSENTPVAPFGFWEFSVAKDKNIGGYVISGYQEGKQAGEIALDYIKHNAFTNKHLTGSHGQLVFSKTQLQKWDIELPNKLLKQIKFVD